MTQPQEAATTSPVLVVDDEKLNRKLIVRLLKKRGFDTLEAENGNAALQRLEDNPGVELVLMDIRMPGLDGLSTTERWREQETTHRVPIVALTANVMTVNREQCLAAGMDDYLTKPIGGTELDLVLRKWLQQSAIGPAERKAKKDGEAAASRDVVNKLEELLDRADGDVAIFRDIIFTLNAEFPSLYADFSSAIRRHDLYNVRTLGHRLRGQLLSVGAEETLGSLQVAVDAAFERDLSRALEAATAVRSDTEALMGEASRVVNGHVHLLERPSVSPPSGGPLVLVADDDDSMRAMLRRFLSRQGYKVELYGNGAELLDTMTSRKPDLIILDAITPTLDSFETCARIRADEEERQQRPVPILTVTALADDSAARRAIEAGADDFITKPIYLPVLKQRINNTLAAREKEKQIEQLAFRDPLTQLPNRHQFQSTLNAALESNREHATPGVLLYIDLDQFKIINDTCGHQAGDELLRQIATILKHKLRDKDLIARLGGDEFGLIMENCGLRQAVTRAKQIINALSGHPFAWKEQSFVVGASIGVVELDGVNGSAEEALSAADTACYSAKNAGRNRVRVYSQDNGDLIKETGEMFMIPELLAALDQNRFMLMRQPIVPLCDAKPARFEVLLRLVDAEGKMLPPTAFIPAAERYQVMDKLDRWVITNVCRGMRSEPEGIIHVNLSGVSVNAEGFADDVIEIIRTSGADPERLCFEITETAAIRNLSAARETLQKLSNLGCELALDDFGSGLSSFGYLKHLPVTMLKIDGRFVQDMAESEFDLAMVTAMETVAKSLRLETVAEFVDSQRVVELLRSVGVDYAQGRCLGEPKPWRP